MKNNIRKILDNTGTVSWFLMDACWMLEFIIPSIVFMILSCAIFLYLLFSNSKELFVDKLITLSTLSWLIMNSVWMIDDITQHTYVESVFIFKTMAFLIGAVSFVIIGILDFNKLKNIRKFRE